MLQYGLLLNFRAANFYQTQLYRSFLVPSKFIVEVTLFQVTLCAQTGKKTEFDVSSNRLPIKKASFHVGIQNI